MNQNSSQKQLIKVGILSGIITALCCIASLIFGAIGLATAAALFAAFFGKYHIFIGLLFFIVATAYILKKKAKCACSNQPLHRHIPIFQVLLSLFIMIIVYLSIAYVIIPWFTNK